MSEVLTLEQTQYLSFYLDDEQYALDITQVREVLDVTKVTKVPKTPDYMLGVINLRGSVVPVIDMCLKFGLPKIDITRDSCIIIVEVKVEEDKVVLGALADSVKEVFELGSEEIEAVPKMGTRLKTDFIKGMGKYNDDFVIILDIDKIFSTQDLSLVQEVN